MENQAKKIDHNLIAMATLLLPAVLSSGRQTRITSSKPKQ